MSHTLYLLPLLVIVSATFLLASVIIPPIARAYKRHKQPPPLYEDEDELELPEPPAPPPFLPSQGLWSDLRAHFRSLRVYGTVIVALDLLRTACLCALLALSIYAAVQAEAPAEEGHKSHLDALLKKKKGRKNRSPIDYTSLEWGEVGACFFYVSCSSTTGGR